MTAKKIIRIPFYFLLTSILLYFILVFCFGGLGKKTPVFTSAGNGDKPLLFAHRGISLYYPENSREGVVGAKLHGFKASEVDIRRSADDQQIIFHDENCERLLGINQEIDSLTLYDLKKHPIVLHNGLTSAAVAPTVDELLASQKGNMIFYFDMKFSSFKDADEIVALIKKHKCERSVILTNWDALFIFYVEAKYPEIMTGLEGFDAGKEWGYMLMPKNLKPDFLSGFYSHTNAEHIAWLKAHELMDSKIVYGVDSTNYDPALKAGFRNIIIDYDSAMNDDTRITNLLK